MFLDDSWFTWIAVLSYLGNCFLAWIIWRNKELQAHPMKLFMYIAICDASAVYYF